MQDCNRRKIRFFWKCGGEKVRIEEIALRQEARQMLCEAGLSKEELKELVLKDIDDKVIQAIESKIKGVDFEQMIMNRVDKALTKAVDDTVRREVEGFFYNRRLNIRATASFEE